MSTSNTLYTESTALMKAHDWAAVLATLTEEALERLDDWRLHWNRAWSQYQLQEFEAALQRFLVALRYVKEPADRATCLTFAGISALSAKKIESSVNYLSQSLILEDRTLTRKTLAWAHMEAGDAAAAERVHQTGLKKRPADRERLAAYGDFLLDQGRVEEAQELMNKINS